MTRLTGTSKTGRAVKRPSPQEACINFCFFLLASVALDAVVTVAGGPSWSAPDRDTILARTVANHNLCLETDGASVFLDTCLPEGKEHLWARALTGEIMTPAYPGQCLSVPDGVHHGASVNPNAASRIICVGMSKGQRSG